MAENLIIPMCSFDLEFKYYVTSSVNGADNVVLYIREFVSKDGDKVSIILTHYKYDDTWYGTYLADSTRNGIHINYRTAERRQDLRSVFDEVRMTGPSFLHKASDLYVIPKDFKEIENCEGANALIALTHEMLGNTRP